MFRKLLAAASILGCLAAPAYAASVPLVTGPLEPSQAVANENALIQSLNANITPGSMAPYAAVRNFLDNGAMQINQRAVTATCGTTSGMAETAYSADRWACDANMASGAGQMAVVTSTPSPPVGFTNSSTLVRNSGSLGQPICAWQEIPTVRATQMAGQNVILSAYLEALAGLSTDNGNQANLYLITGTGSQQGLGSLRSAVGMTTTVKAASVTVATTGIITYSNTFVAGQPVYFTATTMPTGLTSGQTYYVSGTNLSTSQFSVASTYTAAVNAGAIVVPSTAGSTVVVNAPYITPAWAGLAVYGAGGTGPGSAGSAAAASAQQEYGAAYSVPFTLSATQFTRVNTGVISLPTTVTEAAVAVCFTPNVGSSGGSTDGIGFTGVQFEIAGPNQTTPSPYEFKPNELELISALRYAWIYPEGAANVATPFHGVYTAATTCDLQAQLPVQMDVAPAVSFTGTALSASTFGIVAGTTSQIVLASTYLVQSTLQVNGTSAVGLKATTASETAGWACVLTGANGGAVINVGADF